MNTADLEQRLFGQDGPDAGCDESGDRLDMYVDAEAAGQAADRLFSDVAGHLASCGDCREDHDALLALVSSLPHAGDPPGR